MKKVCVFLLSLALIVGAIAACGQNAQTPEASPEATPTVEPTVEPTAEPTPEPTENADQGEVAPLSQGDRENANGVTLHEVFQDVYEDNAITKECLAEIGTTSTIEEDVQAEIDAIPTMANAYSFTLPDDYIQQYLDWRPGGIGSYGQDQYTFEDCDETVYATDTVNERTGPGTTFDVVGTMARGESATRIGKGTGDISDWSKVQLADGSIVYMHNSLLSTTKPQDQTQPSIGTKPSTGNQGGVTGNKPSTGGSDGGSTGGGSSGGYNEYIDPSANDPTIHQRPTEFVLDGSGNDEEERGYDPADLVPSGGGSASFGGSGS